MTAALGNKPEEMVIARVGQATYLLTSLHGKSVETLEAEANTYHDLAMHNARRAVADDTPDDERQICLMMVSDYAWKSRLCRATAKARRPAAEKRVTFV